MFKVLTIVMSVLLSFSASAMKPKDKEFIREGDRLIQKGSYGQKLYHEQQYQIKNGKICPIKNLISNLPQPSSSGELLAP